MNHIIITFTAHSHLRASPACCLWPHYCWLSGTIHSVHPGVTLSQTALLFTVIQTKLVSYWSHWRATFCKMMWIYSLSQINTTESNNPQLFHRNTCFAAFQYNKYSDLTGVRLGSIWIQYWIRLLHLDFFESFSKIKFSFQHLLAELLHFLFGWEGRNIN